MSTVKVRVSEFVNASRQRLAESARRSDALRGGELDRALAELPEEVQQRFLSEQGHATVLALTGFLDTYGRYAAARAWQADADEDGFLSLEDAAKLPRGLQELFHASLWSLARNSADEGLLDAKPTDLTPMELRVPRYVTARAKALRAVLVRDDSPQCARTQLRAELEGDEDGAAAETRLDRALRQKLDQGSIELLHPQAAHALGEDPVTTWLFRIRFGGEGRLSELPFYVAVDRDSGRTHVSVAA